MARPKSPQFFLEGMVKIVGSRGKEHSEQVVVRTLKGLEASEGLGFWGGDCLAPFLLLLTR